MVTRQKNPGTKAATAHWVQEMVMPMVAAARFTDKGLAAMAVMNMALEMHVPWKKVFMR
jgi:hypothetical protein